METITTIAFVGCAHIHTPGFINAVKKRDNIRCKYVYDHDAARAEKRAGELEAQVAGEVARIYDDPEVSAVIVCTETNRHEEVVLPAAAARKHLFVEKPLGFAARDAYAMAQAITDAGVMFQTGYFMRGSAVNIYLKRQIEAGAFGRITRARGSNCHNGALGRWFDTEWRWMTDPAQSGVGAFGDLGTHSLDILLWLLGDVATCTAQIDLGTNAYGCDETGEGLLRFSSGVIGTLAAAWDDVANPVSLLVSGTEGHAAVVNDELFLQSNHIEGADGKTPWAHLPSAVPSGMEAFLNAVTGQRDSVLVTPQEAAYRSAVMEALYIGAREGRWVAPPNS